MNNPFFSIIIPTYNREGFIIKTIRSVLDQIFTDFEVIVVDDGSTDNTREVVERIIDKRLHYYFKENGERGAARNYGIKKSKGKYITFLDSDDLLLSNHFAIAYEFIQKNDPTIFHQQYQIINGDMGKKVKIILPINKALIRGNPLSCMGVFIQREITLQNLFIEDRKISGSEDYELWLRLTSKYPFSYNPICTSSLIMHDDRSVFNINKEKLIERKLLMLDYAFKDKDVKRVYGKYKKTMLGSVYSYISLHIALTKRDKSESVKYLVKSLLINPSIISEKRFFAIIKHLFL